LFLLGQSNGRFAGTWTCEYFGRTLARLELQDPDDAPTGRMSVGAFHVDAEGKLDVVIEEATVWLPIVDVAVHDGVLSFGRKDEEQNRIDRYELRVSGNTASLSFILTEQLLAAAKAVARLDDRGYVTPDDVADVALDVLRHRILLRPEAELERYSTDDAVRAALESVPVPR